ncbi:uncharacterized protein LOC130047074 isoform X6 [Ostrea edulis]|uniref:uncharacterized protein LOC130047074 isoform X6 n=1 Tax=Ostrea edulis TaxID=37623 RepID=UPI0024AF88E1|nr:uncharacterized protein LOC130047074 isoform X6 [Ostrea edulis]
MALAPQANPDFTSETILKRYRPLSRHNIGGYETTYGHMNDWMKVSRDGVPVTMSDNNWHNLKQSEQKNHDIQFKKAFSNLSSKIAYRHPNPGNPRQRQGRIGGSWRHIKEVLGHGGSRVVYVDDPYIPEGPGRRISFSPTRAYFDPFIPLGTSAVESPYHNSCGDFDTWNRFEIPPVQAASPSYQDGDLARKMGLNVSPKYKGFYRYGAK